VLLAGEWKTKDDELKKCFIIPLISTPVYFFISPCMQNLKFVTGVGVRSLLTNIGVFEHEEVGRRLKRHIQCHESQAARS
jgi:hypothetical protein